MTTTEDKLRRALEIAAAQLKNIHDQLGGDELAREIKTCEEALLSAPSVSGEWQPIESAPKDGTQFLGYFGESDDFGIVSRHDPGGAQRNPKHNYECWVVSGSPVGPTHWQPLPSPPSVTTSKGDAL